MLWLYRDHECCRWIYVDEPPYDAVLAEDGVLVEGAVRHVLRIVRGQPGSGVAADLRVVRPVTIEKLHAGLLHIEQRLDAVTNALSLPDAIAALRDEPGMQSVAVAPLRLEEATADQQPLLDSRRYRLLRWPREAILRRDPQRIRMATLLTRRALSEQDLHALTHFSPGVCQTFMNVLMTAELLAPDAAEAPVSDVAVGLAQAVSTSLASPSSAASPRLGLTRHLVASLRRRLGL